MKIKTTIKDKVKKIELLNILKEISIDDKYLNDLITINFQRSGFESLDEYKEFLNNNDVKLKNLKDKIILDTNWKQFIYEKYKNKKKLTKIKFVKKYLKKKLNYFICQKSCLI